MVLSLRDGLREVTEVATDVQVEGLASAEELVAPGATNAIFIGTVLHLVMFALWGTGTVLQSDYSQHCQCSKVVILTAMETFHRLGLCRSLIALRVVFPSAILTRKVSQ